MKNKHFTSYMFTLAGALMVVSSILIAISVNIACGGILLAAASCMFFTAYNFRIAENKKEEEVEQKKNKDEK